MACDNKADMEMYLELTLHPGCPLQQADAFLNRKVTHGAVQSAICQQATERVLALGAAAILAQLSPLQNALSCIASTKL